MFVDEDRRSSGGDDPPGATSIVAVRAGLAGTMKPMKGIFRRFSDECRAQKN
jgi:hypothetical protein